MTADELKRLRELCEKASDGPLGWKLYGDDYIIESRNALPRLLDEIVALREVVSRSFVHVEIRAHDGSEDAKEVLKMIEPILKESP